jgi:hypothetical protein
MCAKHVFFCSLTCSRGNRVRLGTGSIEGGEGEWILRCRKTRVESGRFRWFVEGNWDELVSH